MGVEIPGNFIEFYTFDDQGIVHAEEIDPVIADGARNEGDQISVKETL